MDLAEEVFHMPVRLGVPQSVMGLVDVVRNPIYATGVGLLLFGNQNRVQRAFESDFGQWRARGLGTDEELVSR